MSKYKITAIIYVKDNLGDDIARAFTSTINALENQGLSLRNDIEIFIMMPENELTKHIAGMYELVYPQNCRIIFTDNDKLAIKKCIKQAEGDYITILGAGGLLSAGALKKVYDYFEFAKGNVDVVGVRIISNNKMFDNYNKNFAGKNMNIHFMEMYNRYPCVLDGLFFKANIAREKAKKQDELEFNAETFIAEILIRRNTLGCVASTSVKINISEIGVVTADLFEENIKIILQQLSKMFDEYMFVPDYVQYNAVSMIVRMLNNSEDIMSEYDHPDYDYSEMWNTFSATMKYIDDRIIMALLTTRFNKLFLMYFKYERFCGVDKYYNDIKMFYKVPTYMLSTFPARFELLSISNGKLTAEGIMHFPVCVDVENTKIMADINGKPVDIEMVERYSDRYYYEKPYLYEKGFKLEVPL